MKGRKRSRGTRFAVDLGDVQLPPMTAKAVEAEIRSVVLRAVATMDSGGQRIKATDKDWQKFPGGIAGGVWDSPAPRGDLVSGLCDLCGQPLSGPGPWIAPQDAEELAPQDHTQILRAIMTHTRAVFAKLDDSTTSTTPSGAEVLEAALRADPIDPYTKERIEAVLHVLPTVTSARARTSSGVQRSLKELQGRIADRSIPERVRVLRQAKSRYRSAGMAEGLELAAQILEDGGSSIYSREHPYYGAAGVLVLRDVADAVHASVGGAVGSVTAGIGAGPGAVAAGTEASVRAVIGAFIDRNYQQT